jgi:hypothetical protein
MQMLVSVEHCDCGDVGFHVVPDNFGEPEQSQCEFCYTVPWSAFNLNGINQAFANRYSTHDPLDTSDLRF